MGTCSGVYLAQNYDIPDIKLIATKFLDYVNSLEKTNNQKNNDDQNGSHSNKLDKYK
tara:strand:+ start:369 stop:539 length:171 start_codon:yes stop_codon:yes gene_type:complete